MSQKTKNKKEKWYQKRHLKVLVFLVFILLILHINLKIGSTPDNLFSLNLNTAHASVTGWFADKLGGLLKVGGEVAAAPLIWVFNFLLFAVLLVGYLLLFFAGMLFDWAVNPANFTLVVGNDAVRQGWTIVRDFLNLAFILVLLYSAFCTIFQIEKYHLKKILLTLVLMALLVNFSFPIARFIIDSANVLMYFILSQAFPHLSNSSGLSANIADTFRFAKLSFPDPQVKEIIFPTTFTVKLIMAIIFTFVTAMTLLIIGALLVIRIVVLAILIIFAPVGFVAAIFPSTKNYADLWWTHLFKQSFFGPIMVFMLYLAITMMEAMNKDGLDDRIRQAIAGNKSELSNYSEIIVTGTYLVIPIVIMWVGLIAAQKLGAGGAGAVMHGGRRLANWARRTNTARRQGGRILRAYGDNVNKIFGNIPGYRRVSQATFGKLGDTGAKMEAQAEIDRIKKGKTREDYARAVVSEVRKGWKDRGGASDAELQKAYTSRNMSEKQAAVLEAMETNRIDKLDSSTTLSELDKFKSATNIISANPVLKNVFDKQAREKRVDLVIRTRIDNEATALAASKSINIDTAREEISKEELDKLQPRQWNDQDIVKLLDPNPINNPHYTQIRSAADKVYKSYSGRGQSEVTRNMKAAHYAAGTAATIW